MWTTNWPSAAMAPAPISCAAKSGGRLPTTGPARYAGRVGLAKTGRQPRPGRQRRRQGHDSCVRKGACWAGVAARRVAGAKEQWELKGSPGLGMAGNSPSSCSCNEQARTLTRFPLGRNDTSGRGTHRSRWYIHSVFTSSSRHPARKRNGFAPGGIHAGGEPGEDS